MASWFLTIERPRKEEADNVLPRGIGVESHSCKIRAAFDQLQANEDVVWLLSQINLVATLGEASSFQNTSP